VLVFVEGPSRRGRHAVHPCECVRKMRLNRLMVSGLLPLPKYTTAKQLPHKTPRKNNSTPDSCFSIRLSNSVAFIAGSHYRELAMPVIPA
jgi:hypothetical protein